MSCKAWLLSSKIISGNNLAENVQCSKSVSVSFRFAAVLKANKNYKHANLRQLKTESTQ